MEHRNHGKPASDKSDKDSASMKNVHQENFLAIIITCPKINTVSKDHMEHGSLTVEMASWN